MSEPARGDGLQWQSRVGARMVPGPIGHPLPGNFSAGSTAQTGYRAGGWSAWGPPTKMKGVD